ncbi:IS3 family transposase [Paenibacillus glucanolyticus]|nr:IS3 family transposase [Paenibacillus glucanolyticus]
MHTYPTFEELEKDIHAYIHFYNNEQLQVKLNGLSPMEFRSKAARILSVNRPLINFSFLHLPLLWRNPPPETHASAPVRV